MDTNELSLSTDLSSYILIIFYQHRKQALQWDSAHAWRISFATLLDGELQLNFYRTIHRHLDTF